MKTNTWIAIIMGIALGLLRPMYAQPPVLVKPQIPTLTTVKPLFSTTKELYVLFPHSRDAQKIRVTQDVDGKFIYQEDIRIDTAQIIRDTSGSGTRPVDIALNMRRLRYRRNVTFSAAGALWFDWGIWEDAVIPYKIASDMPQPFRDLIAQGLNHINTKTNLCVRLRESGEDDYVEFVPVKNKAYSGISALGKSGGRQVIELDVEDTQFGSVASFRTVVHETLHAAGFIHEQSRSDRDDFVEILFDNIDNNMGYNFDRDIFSRNVTTYDFRSVMHYGPQSFGKIDTRGNRMTTIRPKSSSNNTIEAGRELSALDIQGVNTLYPTNASCSNRTKKIKSLSISGTDGKLGSDIYERIVSAGWSDAEPIMVNSTLKYMMFLNEKSTYAEIRTIENNGTFGSTPIYNKDWGSGWADIEMLYLNNTTYILHQKRFPLLESFSYYPHGFTRVSKVNASTPFANNSLGTVQYESTWGSGWSIIKFFYVNNDAYMFRYNEDTNKAQIYKLNATNPFANGSIGTLVYEKTWSSSWTVVRFFTYNGKTYCFHLKSSTGEVKIAEINSSNPFGDGNLGIMRFQGDWSSGWTNVNIFTNSNNKTYMFLQKTSQGTAKMMEFKTDAFNQSYPFTDIEERDWSSGWSFTKVYYSPSGFKLLHMKK